MNYLLENMVAGSIHDRSRFESQNDINHIIDWNRQAEVDGIWEIGEAA
jgi:hypothetical protein